MRYIPVIFDDEPVMPAKASRVRKWIKSGKATPYWNHGVFCVRLNKEPSGFEMQSVACGIDPGSKKEGFTVKSRTKTYINIQADAVTWVKKRIELRHLLRRGRRHRKCPHRKQRRRIGTKLPPSTKARWQLKLRILNWLIAIYPITDVAVEDIKAVSWKGAKRWNMSFSPLQVGKKWFYNKIASFVRLHIYQGWETKEMREHHNLKKITNKLSNKWEAHCIDSWVLAHNIIGNDSIVDNRDVLCIVPFQFHRRQIHKIQFQKGGKRPLYGGTRSMGLKRGSFVSHLKYGLSFVGGTSKNRISLHNIENGKRLTQDAKVEDCKFLTYSSWRYKKGSI
tara:strand:+ start:925 stop:1932 length:1008 start_codon:yes stop_codon:yes gene_type:complete